MVRATYYAGLVSHLVSNADWMAYAQLGTMMSLLEGYSGFLQAFVGAMAVLVAGLSIRMSVKTDRRAEKREANDRDDQIQARLDALYSSFDEALGSTDDGVPAEIRPTLISFYVTFSDVYAADRDGLLGSKDNDPLLDEFKFWSRRANARLAWRAFRHQTWPKGFADYVEKCQLETSEPYKEGVLKSRPAAFEWPLTPTPMEGMQGKLSDIKEPDLRNGLVKALKRLRGRQADQQQKGEDSEWTAWFPDCKDSDDGTVSIWLIDHTKHAVFSWVAFVASDPEPVGYVQLCDLSSYLKPSNGSSPDSLDRQENRVFAAITNCTKQREPKFYEIKCLFVDPQVQNCGFADSLMKVAIKKCVEAERLPILTVLENWTASIGFYEKRGWKEITSFAGSQGRNLVMMRAVDVTLP